MNPTILITNATAISAGTSRRCDILVAGGRIARMADRIGREELPAGAEVVDAAGCIVTCGLADVHVHLREPGFSAKETIATGTRAAARGGYTVVCAMPNLNPVPDTPEHLRAEQELIDAHALIDVRPYAAITLGRRGAELVDFAALADSVAGFSDDGSGVQQEQVMADAMRRAAECDAIIAAHCEVDALLGGGYIHDGEYARSHAHRGICSESEWSQIVRDTRLAAQTGCRYHACHVSTAEGVEAIRRAKAAGVNASCETAPHYLVLTEDDLQEDGRFKMNPPLRTRADRDALLRGICDGTVEVIATDHAPHTAEEKSRGLSGSAMGIVGLETAFAVVYTKLVLGGIITVERMIELMCDNPRRIFRLGGALREGEAADIAIFDVTTPYRIDSSEFLSKGRSTPFEGWEVRGRCVATFKEGRAVWRDESAAIWSKK